MEHWEVDQRMKQRCPRCNKVLLNAFLNRYRNRSMDARRFLSEYQGYCCTYCRNKGEELQRLRNIQNQRINQEIMEERRRQEELYAKRVEDFYKRECPNCSEFIQRKAKTCHYCNTEMTDWQKQRKRLEQIEILVEEEGYEPWDAEGRIEERIKEEERQKRITRKYFKEKRERKLSQDNAQIEGAISSEQDRNSNIEQSTSNLIKSSLARIDYIDKEIPISLYEYTVARNWYEKGCIEKSHLWLHKKTNIPLHYIESACSNTFGNGESELSYSFVLKPSFESKESTFEKDISVGGFFGIGGKTIDVKYRMQHFPPSTYIHGALEEDQFAEAHQFSTAPVTFTKGFALGKSLVNVEFWHAIMGGDFKEEDKDAVFGPVDLLKVYEFCNKLSELDDKKPAYTITYEGTASNKTLRSKIEFHPEANGYRLPTTFEWEYAFGLGERVTYALGRSTTKLKSHPLQMSFSAKKEPCWGTFHNKLYEEELTDPSLPKKGLYYDCAVAKRDNYRTISNYELGKLKRDINGIRLARNLASSEYPREITLSLHDDVSINEEPSPESKKQTTTKAKEEKKQDISMLDALSQLAYGMDDNLDSVPVDTSIQEHIKNIADIPKWMSLYSGTIPAKKIKNAKKEYAGKVTEEILMLCDSSFWGGGGSGFVLTENYLVSSNGGYPDDDQGFSIHKDKVNQVLVSGKRIEIDFTFQFDPAIAKSMGLAREKQAKYKLDTHFTSDEGERTIVYQALRVWLGNSNRDASAKEDSKEPQPIQTEDKIGTNQNLFDREYQKMKENLRVEEENPVNQRNEAIRYYGLQSVEIPKGTNAQVRKTFGKFNLFGLQHHLSVCVYPITQKQYFQFTGKRPSQLYCPDAPVTRVTWFDAVKFANLLSRTLGLEEAYIIYGKEVICNVESTGWRLPTEIEWKTLSGNIPLLLRKNKTKGWFKVDSPQEVGRQNCNHYGIFDTLGNVEEWCWDWYIDDKKIVEFYKDKTNRKERRTPSDGTQKVTCGGSFSARPVELIDTDKKDPNKTYDNVGFRLVRTVKKDSLFHIEFDNDKSIPHIETIAFTKRKLQTFFFGKIKHDNNSFSGEEPQVSIQITRPYEMMIYPLTVGLYHWIENGSWKDTSRYPMGNISWEDAVKMANKLSEKMGYKKAYSIKGTKIDCDFDANGWRLPTEAEWAQAAKSGSNLSWTPRVNLFDEKTSIYSGSHIIEDVAWFGDREFDVSSKTWKATGKGNCERAMPVGLKKAVRPGIYDLSGNVGEWCWDNYKGSWFKELKDKNLVHVINPQGPSEESEKVIRGGSFERGPRGNRITYRRRGKKSLKRPDIGVRFVRTLDKQVKK